MPFPALYAIVDAGMARSRGWTVPGLARAYFEGGARLVQVRAKDATGAEYLDLCAEVVALAAPYGATVIVNDRADVAALCGAAGVHVGQEDLDPEWVRRAFPRLGLVGLSTHTPVQVDEAAGKRIDYLAVGPVFPTGTKATGYTQVGLALVRRARGALDGTGAAARPVVAIGGITLERAPSVIEAGAAAVAVISDLLAGNDPAARVSAYLAVLSR